MNTTVVEREVRQVGPEPVSDEHPQASYNKKKTIYRTYQILWYFVGIIEFLLLSRFLLRFLAANPASGFANLIYGLSLPFVTPFINLFRSSQVGSSVVEWSTLAAAIIYPLLAYGIVYLLQIVKPTTPYEVERKVNY